MAGTAWIVDAVRTPRGRGKAGKGALSGVHPQELMAQALNHVVARTCVAAKDVEDVIVGCVSQVGEQGACIGRNSVLAAGFPLEVTGVSLNRMCGSGLQAVNFAVMGVMSGLQDVVVGGGVESMSRQPIMSDGGGTDGNNPGLREKHPTVPQGISADLIASLEGFSREDVDAFALKSQQNAQRARIEGRFAKSLVPVRDKNGEILLAIDEHPRADTTLEGLGQLKIAFQDLGATRVGPNGETLDEIALAKYPQAKQIRHVHTGGNSSGMVDGAAAVLVASDRYVKKAGLKPRARIRSMALAGDEPLIMLTAPTPASRKALEKAGMSVKDVDLWEINEAFAVVPLKTMRDLGLDPERVNVNGGAIALGHPLGATGAMLLGTVLDELERTGKSIGLITLCIGGGMGIATVIERV